MVMHIIKLKKRWLEEGITKLKKTTANLRKNKEQSRKPPSHFRSMADERIERSIGPTAREI